MSFKAGDKVVCVDDSPGFGTLNGHYDFPKGYVANGEIYCVDRLEIDPNFEPPDRIRVFICGKPAIYQNGSQTGWCVTRFRLVHRCKDAVSVSETMEAGP